MGSLWNLEKKYVELQDALVESRGVVTPEVQTLMDKIGTATIATVFSLQDMREELKDFADTCKKRAEEFNDKAKAYLAAAERVKQVQIDAISMSGMKSIKNGAYKITVQPTPLKVDVIAPELLPSRYVNAIVTLTMDDYNKLSELGINPTKVKFEENKKLLSEDYKKENIEVEGAEYTTGLTIRVT